MGPKQQTDFEIPSRSSCSASKFDKVPIPTGLRRSSPWKLWFSSSRHVLLFVTSGAKPAAGLSLCPTSSYLSRSRNRSWLVHTPLCTHTHARVCARVCTRKRATGRENERGTFNSRFRESSRRTQPRSLFLEEEENEEEEEEGFVFARRAKI